MNSRDTISKKRTYMLLQSRLLELLADTPFEKLTMTEICNAAMIPRSTFYRYFEDKYDLLRFCLQSLFEEMHLTEEVIYFTNKESFHDFAQILIRYVADNLTVYQKVYQTNKDDVLMQMIREDVKAILTEKLVESRKHGYIPKISLPVFVTLLTDFYFSIITCYLELEQQVSVETFAEHVCLFADHDFFIIEKKKEK